MPKYLKINLITSLILSQIATPLIANTDDLSQIETIVTTANRANVSHISLIGNTSVIGQQAIEQINAEHLNQALNLSSGVWLSRGNGQESLLSIRSPVLTGAGSCAEFLTLENNIALRAPGFCNVNQLFDSHFETSDRIEVVKGSNSARYGSNAIHGTINILNNLHNTNSRIALDLGSNDFYRFDGRFGQDTEHSQLGIAATITRDGGYQDSSGYQQQKVSMALAHDINNWQTVHRFSFTNLNQDTAGYLQQGEEAYKDKSLLKVNEFPDAYRDSVSVRYSMRNELQQDTVMWQITPYLRHTEMDFLMHFLPGTPVEENGHSSLGIQLKQINQISDVTRLQIGSDIDFTQGFLTQTQANDTQSGSAFLRAVLPKGAQYDYQVDARNIALYGQIDGQLSEHQHAFLALRFDNTEYDYDNKLADGNLKPDGTACGFGGCRYTRPADQKNTFSDVSVSFGYGYTLSNNTTLFAKYDDSFRAPHTSELYRLQNGQLISEIDSVNAIQQELGLRYSDHSVFAEVSLYNLDKTKGIYQGSDRQYLNGLDTQHRGIELDINWQITNSLSTRLNTSFARHTYENNPSNGKTIQGNEIDTSPRVIANGSVNWQVVDALSLQIEFNHLDGYYLDAENTTQYSGHTVTNLRSNWQISPQFSANIAILNLLDTRYAERADYAFGNHRYFIGEPRGFMANLRYQF